MVIVITLHVCKNITFCTCCLASFYSGQDLFFSNVHFQKCLLFSISAIVQLKVITHHLPS